LKRSSDLEPKPIFSIAKTPRKTAKDAKKDSFAFLVFFFASWRRKREARPTLTEEALSSAG
jgi:hypothetical protein